MTATTASALLTAADLARLDPLVDAVTLQALALLTDGAAITFAICDPDGDEMDDYYLSNASIDRWDDDCGETIYQLGERAFAHKSHTKWQGLFAADDIADFLSSWDHDSYGSREACFVAFGVDVDLDEAAEDYEGECKIWVAYNYYKNHTNPPQDAWVTAEDDYQREPLVFESYAAAQEWIEETEDSARGYKSETNPRGSYLLSHGQASPPSYTICKA